MQQALSKHLFSKAAAIVVALAATVGLIGFNVAAQHGSGNSPADRKYQKEQCKDGGWEEMGYKNQGDCVSHFASDGRN